MVAALVAFRAAALVRAEPVKSIAGARLTGNSGRNGVSSTDATLTILRSTMPSIQLT
jgi:hypothetical protein